MYKETFNPTLLISPLDNRHHNTNTLNVFNGEIVLKEIHFGYIEYNAFCPNARSDSVTIHGHDSQAS